MSTAAPTSEEPVKSKRPSSSAFKQQRLPAWQPILTAGTVLPTFFVIGIAFIPIGIGLLISSNDVQEYIVDYTDCNSTNPAHGNSSCHKVLNETGGGGPCECECEFVLDDAFKKDVFMYYGLTNYYQNHRRYVKSRDDRQLLGKLDKTVIPECAPFAYFDKVPIAPCGAIANSLFNDTITLTWQQPKPNSEPQPTEVGLLKKGIAWPTDKSVKFQNPDHKDESLKKAFEGFHQPPAWLNKTVYDLDKDDEDNNGFQNEDLIVWMRTAALPTFRKLYRRIDHSVSGFSTGLPKGTYKLKISYAYPVKSFDGRKRIILSTTSWLGGKNPFLGIAYIVVGCICLGLGIVFLVVHIKFGKSTQDMVNITQRTGY